MLTLPSDPSYADYPASWSPDGTRILFTRTSFSKPDELFVVDAAGGTPHALGIPGSAGAWGPSRIAWVDSEAIPAALWTALPDGSDRRKIAEASGSGRLYGPSWSHDGRLAYLEGKSSVDVLSPAGAEHDVQLPFAEIASLAWSPDGTRFVVSARAPSGATFDLYTVRTDGTDPVRLTTDMNAGSPSWR